jgi:hypothetical protein
VKPTITAAGNTVVPAYLSLLTKGYVVRREGPPADDEFWVAENEHRRFSAGDLVELLGVVALFEMRGEDWPASDEEIDRFLSEFGYA